MTRACAQQTMHSCTSGRIGGEKGGGGTEGSQRTWRAVSRESAGTILLVIMQGKTTGKVNKASVEAGLEQPSDLI